MRCKRKVGKQQLLAGGRLRVFATIIACHCKGFTLEAHNCRDYKTCFGQLLSAEVLFALHEEIIYVTSRRLLLRRMEEKKKTLSDGEKRNCLATPLYEFKEPFKKLFFLRSLHLQKRLLNNLPPLRGLGRKSHDPGVGVGAQKRAPRIPPWAAQKIINFQFYYSLFFQILYCSSRSHSLASLLFRLFSQDFVVVVDVAASHLFFLLFSG